MGHTGPDFGGYAPRSITYPMGSLDELAVRLGSIDIFDRRGQVICLDDCEAPVLKWYKTVAGEGAAILDDTTPKSGAQDIKMISGSGGLDYVYLAKGFSLLPSKRLGFEFCFSLPGGSAYLGVKIWHYDGTNVQKAEVRLNFNTDVLSYKDSSGNWVELATLPSFTTKSYIYYPFKLVADFETGYYQRLLRWDTWHDLSEHAIYQEASAVFPHTDHILELVRVVTPGSDIYLDDFIFTMDEP